MTGKKVHWFFFGLRNMLESIVFFGCVGIIIFPIVLLAWHIVAMIYCGIYIVVLAALIFAYFLCDRYIERVEFTESEIAYKRHEEKGHTWISSDCHICTVCGCEETDEVKVNHSLDSCMCNMVKGRCDYCSGSSEGVYWRVTKEGSIKRKQMENSEDESE